MALNQECHNCGHIQLVGLVENGRGGFPDPHAVCEACGKKGTFYYPSPISDRELRQLLGVPSGKEQGS